MSPSFLETGRTTERISCDCGEAFSVSVYRVLNLSADRSLLDSLLEGRLNRVRCEHCGKEFPADTPVNLHDPEANTFICLFPSAWRSRELELRIHFFQELLGQGSGSIPRYVREAKFMFGLEACAAALGRRAAPEAVVVGVPELPERLPQTTRARIQELEESDFEQVCDVESVDRRDTALVQRWKESGQNHYTFHDEGALHIFQRVRSPEEFGERADLFFQLHRIENFPLIVMLMVTESKQGPSQVLFWLFNLENKIDVRFLEQLAIRFEVRLQLFDQNYNRRRILVFSPPLEQNVEYVLDEARAWYEKIEAGRRNFFIAASKFDETSYSRLGRPQSGLDPAAFRELPFPSVTKLALEILTYWSSKQNYEYLIFIKSLPVHTFKTILAEVLGRAIHFGLGMTEKMKRLSVEMHLAPSKEALVRTLFANFAEVSTGLRQNDLDPQSQCENWQQLFQDAQLLGCAIDPEIQELRESAQKRLDDAREAIPLDLSDDVEMLSTLKQLTPSELVALLAESEHRAEAARALAESGRQEFFPAVARAFNRMSRREVDCLGDGLGAFGEVARGFLVEAAGCQRSSQVVGALRSLVRLDGARAAPRLIGEALAGRRGVWREAIELLKNLAEVPVASVLEASHHQDASARSRMIPVLAGHRSPLARSRLQEMATADPVSRVRMASRRALEVPPAEPCQIGDRV